MAGTSADWAFFVKQPPLTYWWPARNTIILNDALQKSGSQTQPALCRYLEQCLLGDQEHGW
jgi:hypothetical protein